MSSYTESHALTYGPQGWWVTTSKTYPSGVAEVRSTKTLPDFLLEQTTPPADTYSWQNTGSLTPVAVTPQEAAQQLAVESILSRSMTLANAEAFKDAGVHPYNTAAVNRLAASTLSRDVENFLDGLGMFLQPSELDALTDYLESRG